MAKIVKQGNKPDPALAWYLTRELACPLCGAVFLLEKRDFEGREVGVNYDEPTWRVTMTERTPHGKQIIAGKCPDCNESISITGKMGGAGMSERAAPYGRGGQEREDGR